MKILFLTRLFYPQIGGVEKHVMEISKILIQRGHYVSIVTEKIGNDPEFEEINGIKIYRIFAGTNERLKKFRVWYAIWKLRRIIAASDIVHCHDVFFWYLPFRMLYFHKPVFTTFHGYESFPITKKAVTVRKISEILSFGNICIGDFIKKWYGTKPTFISYGGVDTQSMPSVKQTKKETALFIGRFDEQTGIMTYIGAVRELNAKNYDFDMTAVGDGKFRGKLKQKNIKLLGFQKKPERYYPDYHFAFVSRYLSILEAFAARKLVFAVFDNPVKEDYLRMAPFAKWIVMAGDSTDLAEKVAYYLMHQDLEKKMTDKAYAWVKYMTWEKAADRYMRLWEIKN